MDFSSLPTELITEIVKYLTIEDCVNFCTAIQQFKNFRVISKIDLARCYKVDIEKVPSTITCERVKSVNLNYCHWLSKNTLQDFILQLPNVEILSALDTKLDLTGDDVEILNKTKIHRLAVTLSNSHSGTKCSLHKINELFLDIGGSTLDYFEEDFNENVKLPNVEKVRVRFLAEVWYEEFRWPGQPDVPIRIQKWLRNCAEDKLLNVTFWLHGYDISMPENWNSLRKYYETASFRRSRLVCYENINNFERVPHRRWNITYEDDDDDEDNKYFEIPFGPNDTVKLDSGKETLETIKCKELFFVMGEHSDVYSEILKAKAPYVETLEIHCDETHDIRALYILNHQSLIHLKHLALYSIWDLDAHYFHLVSQFTALKSLHVDIPPKDDATTFLPVVFKSCTSLQQISLSLSIDYEAGENPDCSINKFLAHLSDALVYANNLKEFFFQSRDHMFRIDGIISILNCRKQIKLLKLKMMINMSEKLNADIWNEYFRENEQLMDCVIGIRILGPDKKIADKLCKMYERPYRKLRIVSDCYGGYDLEVEICENTPCSMKIDDDFFFLNN